MPNGMEPDDVRQRREHDGDDDLLRGHAWRTSWTPDDAGGCRRNLHRATRGTPSMRPGPGPRIGGRCTIDLDVPCPTIARAPACHAGPA